MAFPTTPTTAAGRIVTGVQANTTATRTFPALSGLTKASGDLLIAVCVAYQTSTGTNAAFSGWSDGFTEFFDSASSTTMAVGAAYKWSDGTETAAITVTQAATITGHACFILLAVPGAHASSPPEAGSRASGTTGAADPANFTPSWGAEDILWMAFGAGGEVSTTGSFTGVANINATNFSGIVSTAISGDVAGGVNAAVCFRAQNAASQDVAALGYDVSDARNAAWVMAVRPAAAAGPVTVNPAVIARSFTVPSATRNIGAGPAVAAATTTLPAATRNIGAGPAVAAATTTLPAANRHVAAGPAVAAASAALPAATPQVGTNATAIPAAVAVTTTLPISVRNIAAGPSVAAATTTVPNGARNVGAGPGALAAVATLGAPTTQTATVTTPAATVTTTTLPASTRTTAAGPASVPATVTIPTATAGMGAGPTRQFDSTDDRVICAVGSGGMATLATGAWTVATLARRSTDGTWDTIASFETSGNSAQAGLQIRDTNLLCGLFASDNNSTGGVAAPASDGWCVYAVTKASGTATPRTHKVVVSTGTPTHTNATSSHGNGASLSGGRLQFGRWQSSDLLGGWLAMVAAWDQVLSDGEVEQLAVGLQEWLDLNPTGLWQFRQASTGTAVTDDIGDADQTSLTGTTVDADEGPAPFDWEVSGDATVTPATVAATATLPTGNRNTTAGPAAVPLLVGSPQATATAGTNATPTPAVISLTADVGMGVGSNTATVPAALPVSAAVGQATPQTATGATATPATLAALTALARPNVNVAAGPVTTAAAATLTRPNVHVAAGPLVVPMLATLPQATPQASATKTPTTIPAVAALPQAAAVAGGGATAAPAVIPLNAGVGAGIGVDITFGPVPVATVAAAPPATPTSAADATATPATLPVVAVVAQATPVASSTRTPAAIPAAVTIGGVAASIGASSAVLAALTGLPRPSVNVAAGPAVVPVVVALPQAATVAGGGATAQPLVIATLTALVRPNINVVAGPAQLAASTALSRPLVDVGAGPVTLLSVVALPQATPQVGAGGNPTPATVTAIAALARPNVNVRAGPAVVPLLVAFPAALAGQSISRTPTTITAVAGLAAVAVSTSAGPPAIAVLITLPAVADVGGEPNPGGGLVVIGVPGGGLAVAIGHGHGLVVMPTRGTVSAGRTASEVTVG